MKRNCNIANAITASRMVFAALLLFTPAFSAFFFACYLLGAVTDMVDGTIARALHQQSPFGAKLDTVADFVFVIAVMGKITAQVYIPLWLWLWIGLIAIPKMFSLISGFVRHGKLVAEHTLLNKLTGGLLFLLPITIGLGSFPWQALAVQCILTCAVATVAAVQEGCYVWAGKEIG